MRKFIFLVIAIFGVVMTSSAQKDIDVLHNELSSIPSFFTANGNPYFMETKVLDVSDKRNYVYSIYDYDLNKIATFSDNNFKSLYLTHYFEDGYKSQGQSIMFTQTLFNDDSDWEYIERVEETFMTQYGYERERIKSYRIMKSTGDILGEIDATKYILGGGEDEMIIVGNKCYVAVGEDIVYDDYPHATVTRLYTIPEFRKLIFGDTNGIVARASMERPANNQAYDLYGRKVGSDYKGIVVKDNVKLIQK